MFNVEYAESRFRQSVTLTNVLLTSFKTIRKDIFLNVLTQLGIL